MLPINIHTIKFRTPHLQILYAPMYNILCVSMVSEYCHTLLVQYWVSMVCEYCHTLLVQYRVLVWLINTTILYWYSIGCVSMVSEYCHTLLVQYRVC